mmetsp:Transcript_72766/g.229217  ORF Transcript_72766/g.229217 Transcript_72766/m.229217 type:complete len:200 (-) Transcript_72766:1045-1644(-)
MALHAVRERLLLVGARSIEPAHALLLHPRAHAGGAHPSGVRGGARRDVLPVHALLRPPLYFDNHRYSRQLRPCVSHGPPLHGPPLLRRLRQAQVRGVEQLGPRRDRGLHVLLHPRGHLPHLHGRQEGRAHPQDHVRLHRRRARAAPGEPRDPGPGGRLPRTARAARDAGPHLLVPLGGLPGEEDDQEKRRPERSHRGGR